MARVPVWPGGGVAPAPLPTPMERPAPNTGMDDFGRGLQQAASTGIAIAEDWRQKAETIQKDGVLAKQEQWWTENFHDDQNGFKTKKGEAAFGGEAKLFEDYEKARQGWLAEITSPRAREAAAAASQKTLLAHKRQTENYISQQREVAAGASLVARKATALDALALNYADPAERARLRESVAESERTHAVSAEAAEAAVAQWDKEVDALVIRRYLDDKDADGAKAYFSQARDRLGKDAARIGREIDAVGRGEEAERLAIGFVEDATDDESGRVDRDAAEAKLDSIKDVAVRDEARRRLEHRLALADRSWQRQEVDHHNSAITAYERGGNSIGAIDPRDKEWLIEHAPKRWQEIERMAQADIDRWKRNAEGGGGEADDYDKFVLDLAKNPQKYREMDADGLRAEWRTRLSKANYKQAADDLAALQADKSAAISDRQRVFDAAMDTAGIKGTDKDDLHVAFTKWVMAKTAENGGRAPSHADMQKWAEQNAETVIEKGILWNSKRPRGLVDPEEIVPPSITPQARAVQLREQGMNPAQIAETLNREYSRGR